VCGPSSAIGLDVAERELWPQLRERFREPGSLMALMRGVLGGDVDVAAVTTVTPAGLVTPLALLVTPGMADELTLHGPSEKDPDVWYARIGEDEVRVVTRGVDATPIAIPVTPWITQHLTLFARRLWNRR
jgi:hypothetical protein